MSVQIEENDLGGVIIDSDGVQIILSKSVYDMLKKTWIDRVSRRS